MKALYIVALLAVSVMLLAYMADTYADGTVYTGTEKTLKCDNPTARTDGTPLPASEIDRIEIHISPNDLDLNPPYTTSMPGGCADTQFDLTPLAEGQYYQYGVTYDTSGRVSALSASLPFMRSLLNPLPPVMVE
jgi:hypothetical protein